MMIISKIWIIKLPDIDQGIEKHVIQKGRVLSICEKSYEEKRKKNPILVYISISIHTKIKFCMQNFFFKKCLFENENQFPVKKNNWGQFRKTLCRRHFCRRHQKNACHTFSIYGNCMVSIFLTKSFSFLCSTIHRILCQNKRNFFRKFDDTF